MTSTPWLEAVSELHRQATLYRKRGDALRRTSDGARTVAEYRAGVRVFEEVLQLLKDPRWYRLEEFSSDTVLPSDQLAIAKELVEAWGARGGLLRRLGESRAALDSYIEGAKVENKFVPRSTYNRVNVVKYALLAGLRSLAEIEQEISSLEKLLTDQLAKDQELSDSGWAWADLGDCRALLGDVPGAERAYRTFVDKARSNAPNTTLEVLREIVSKLDETRDPRAAAVRTSLSMLEQRLA
jgi:tetratricopeptide (TPR) repeat protein